MCTVSVDPAHGMYHQVVKVHTTSSLLLLPPEDRVNLRVTMKQQLWEHVCRPASRIRAAERSRYTTANASQQISPQTTTSLWRTSLVDLLIAPASMVSIIWTKITEVNLSAFAYRLFHENFSSILRAKCSGISTVSDLYIQQFGRDSI